MPTRSPLSHPFTKIICTLGPACKSEEQVLALAEAGMNVARLNLSHGAWEDHAATIRMLENINAKLKKQKHGPTSIGILLDTKGPEVRTGMVAKPLEIRAGEKVIFSYEERPKERFQVITVNHEHFAKDVQNAESILLDNGTMTFELLKVQRDGSVLTRAIEGGSVGSRRHVNLPGADLNIDTVTDRDWEDIGHGAETGIDFLALSFVRTAKEVDRVRAFLRKKGRKDVMIISKIETRQAVENLDEIIDASDGIMVARGDLGAEVAFERIPVIQDQLVVRCREAGKPVIVATHMLESMIDNPMPTRAEVTDIAHAAMTGTDSTMLSGETASGKHPQKSLEAMMRVLRSTEQHLLTIRKRESAPIRSEREARAEAAVSLAVSSGAAAIVVMTKSGQSAREVSRFRPSLPIIACTPDELAQHTLQLSYGVIPLVVSFSEKDPETTVHAACQLAKERGLLKKKDRFVLVSDSKAHNLTVNTVQVRELP